MKKAIAFIIVVAIICYANFGIKATSAVTKVSAKPTAMEMANASQGN